MGLPLTVMEQMTGVIPVVGPNVVITPVRSNRGDISYAEQLLNLGRISEFDFWKWFIRIRQEADMCAKHPGSAITLEASQTFNSIEYPCSQSIYLDWWFRTWTIWRMLVFTTAHCLLLETPFAYSGSFDHQDAKGKMLPLITSHLFILDQSPLQEMIIFLGHME